MKGFRTGHPSSEACDALLVGDLFSWQLTTTVSNPSWNGLHAPQRTVMSRLMHAEEPDSIQVGSRFVPAAPMSRMDIVNHVQPAAGDNKT